VFGNLKRVDLPSGDVIVYVVDGQNRRVGKKKNGAIVKQWLYRDQLHPVAELDGSGTLISRFVYASGKNSPDYVIQAGGVFRILSDQLGSPRLLVNVGTGAIAQRMREDEFGNVVEDTSPGSTPFGFAGGLYDTDTGLVRFGARDYDPVVGRWTSKDVTRFRGGVNLYTYAMNDPVNLVDRTGKQPTGAGGASGSDPEAGGEGTSSTGETPSYPMQPHWCGSGWSNLVVPDGAFGADWSDACHQHDDCYSTCGSDKLVCDVNLDKGVSASCSNCGPVGTLYGAGVYNLGQSAFDNAQAQACSCH
jgi:RHS repeat-associated protein